MTPIANEIAGEKLGDDFAPRIDRSGKVANAANLRTGLEQAGYQIVGSGSFDAPLSRSACGWLESGNIDSLGHSLQGRLARQLEQELERLVERVLGLLEAGWRAVRVVTDHGWLFLPGGLPKVDLPRHVTETRWARCAVVSGHSTPDVPRAAWYWNGSQWFATAPGIACFDRSEEYAHGGLSIQECLIPDLTVERVAERELAAEIRSITWRGFRCFVEVRFSGGPVRADLRLQRPSGPSVAAADKPVEPDGSVSLVLESDEHESAELVVVVLDSEGNILAQQSTRVGEDS